MSDVRANDKTVIEGHIDEPARGVWTAHLEVDDDDGAALVGAVTITVGGVSFVGMAEGAVEQGRFHARVVGGKGGLKTALAPKYYYQTSARAIALDILRESGEELDLAESDAVVLEQTLVRWARRQCDARAALSDLAAELDGFWRLTRAGKVCLKRADRYEPLLAAGVVEIERDAAGKVVTIAPDAPIARPGVMLGADKIAVVRTSFASGDGLRQTLTLQDAQRSRGFAAAIQEASKRATEGALTYAQWYPSRVVRQDGDGSVHIYPDDARMRGNGLTHVPVRHGIPGLKVKLVPGERVLLFFENGNPKQPAAALWPDGSSVAEVVLTTERFVVVGDVLVGSATPTHEMVLGDVLKTLLEQLTVLGPMGPSSTPLNAAAFATFLSKRHKLDE